MYSPESGKIFLSLPFVLDAEQIHHIGGRQHLVEFVRHRHAELLKLARHQCARPDQRDPRAQFQERKDVRARDPAEKNVADDRDMQTGDRAPLFPDRVKVEQPLGRMLVRAVAGVDHARPDAAGEKLRRAGRAVPQDDDVGVIRFEHPRGVFERFAFRQAGSRRRDVDDVGAQAFGGELEGSAGARARFDEEIDQRFALQAPGPS